MADEDYFSDQFPDEYFGDGYFPDGPPPSSGSGILGIGGMFLFKVSW